MGVIKNIISNRVANKCDETLIVPCDGPGKDSEITGGMEVIYPSRTNGLLPLSGGAIVKIPLGDIGIQSDFLSSDVNDKILKRISNYGDSISGMVNFRSDLNKLLINIGPQKVLLNGSKVRAPRLILSSFFGDDSFLRPDIASSRLNNVCEFNYIPIDLLSKATRVAIANNGLFGDIVGASGYSFLDLIRLLSSPMTDQDIISVMIDLLPFLNISEANISGADNWLSSIPSGGFYIIVNNSIYIKMPDLTGRDSSGVSNELLSDITANLYIEFLYRGHVSRAKFSGLLSPVFGTEAESVNDIPITSQSEQVVVDINSYGDLSNVEGIYLSLLSPDITIKASRIKEFNNYVDIFSHPTLSEPVMDSYGVKVLLDPSANLASSISGITNPASQITKNVLEKYYNKEFVTGGNGEVLYNFESIISWGDPEFVMAEKNRGDIVLSDTISGKLSNKNDNKYFREKAISSIPILCQHRPRFSASVPNLWIKSTSIIRTSPEVISVAFSNDDFLKINISDKIYGGVARFAVYIKDHYGQITRVSGASLSLEIPSPEISIAIPDGFLGGIGRVTSGGSIRLELSGNGLSGAKEISIRSLADNSIKVTTLNDFSGFVVNNSSDFSLVITSDISNYFPTTTSGLYEIVIKSFYNIFGAPIIISVTQPGEDLKIKGITSPTISPGDISGIGIFNKYIYGIPVSYKQNASISLKSKSRVFRADVNLYGYIAFNLTDSDIVNKMSIDDIRTVKIGGRDYLIPSGIRYDLGSEDFNIINSRRATLSFPGNAYSLRNFSDLINLNSAYLVFSTSQIISDATLKDGTYSLVNLGSLDEKPFSGPPLIKGIYIKESNDRVLSTTQNFKEEVLDFAFSSKSKIIGSGAVAKDKIKRMVIAIEGAKTSLRMSKDISFYIGTDNIDKRRFGRIRELNGGGLLAKFRNITPTAEGVINLYATRFDKKFNISLTSETITFVGTARVVRNDFSEGIVDGVNVLTLNADISEPAITGKSGFEMGRSSGNLDSIVGAEMLGVSSIVRRESINGKYFNFFNPITITSQNLLSVKQINSNAIETISPLPLTALSLINSNFSVNSGQTFSSNSYVKGSSDALIFYDMKVSNPSTIKFNVVEILGISKSDNGDLVSINSFNNEVFNLNTGDIIDIEVANNSDKLEVIISGEAIKPISILKKPSSIILKVKIPKIAINTTCYDICVSSSNRDRISIQRILGPNIVANIDEVMIKLKAGVSTEGIPDPIKERGRLIDFPLRFCSVVLDKANIHPDQINSFCDYSFNLTADLSVALNGFQVLMTPVKVIFCIIDVLCSLMNPVKVSRAVIRLFECLYDLILLLPQISVPVMYLQLTSHIIEVLKCLMDKLIGTFNSINHILIAMEIESKKSSKNVNYQGLKSLEEVLSAYLYEIDVSLSIIDPIVSILATFTDLLQLAFRFPCSVTPGEDPICGLDGTMLAGMIAGIVAPNNEILPERLIPICQSYSTKPISLAAKSITGSAPYTTPVTGNNIMAYAPDGTLISSIEVNNLSMRGGIDFASTFAPSFTKMSKQKLAVNIVEFKFNSQGENSLFSNRKVVDPLQTLDTPLVLMTLDQGGLSVAGSTGGNIFSPLDGYEFLSFINEEYNVKPLTIEFEVPIYGRNPATNKIEEIRRELKFRTFDNVPSLAILDEDFNVYFIEKNGIKTDSNGRIISIRAMIKNKPSLDKIKFSKETISYDSNGDGNLDKDTSLYDFPQIYFVDMRQVDVELESACATSSINSFVLDNGDTASISSIVQSGDSCLNQFLNDLRTISSNIQTDLTNGIISAPVSIAGLQDIADTFSACLTSTADDMCKYVVNSLNTSFRVFNDNDNTSLAAFPDLALSQDVLSGFAGDSQSITGAKEYGSGIGDSGISKVGSNSKIILIPRDSYDIIIPGDFSQKIIIDIVSDTTGNAKILFKNGSPSEFINGEHVILVTSSSEGEVKIRARICNRVVQAISYDGLQSTNVQGSTAVAQVDCIPQKSSSAASTTSPSVGALTKVDRILTIYFAKKGSSSLSSNDKNMPITNPQVFGSKLRN